MDRIRTTLGSLLVGALFATLAVAPASAGAAVITPNTTADQFNTDPANCSLREAVWAADNNSTTMAPGCTAGAAGEDTIQLAPGRYELTIPRVADTIASGDLEHSTPIKVEGLPGGPVTIDANQIDRIFQTSVSGNTLTIDGVTLTGGFVDSPAPGIATTGGAIAASGGSILTMTDSAVVGNRADGSGGGIRVPGSVSLTNVTISGNTSTEQGGGGIHVSGSSTLTLDHVTITDNHAVTNGTMSGGDYAGGVSVSSPATATVHISIIAQNTENSSAEDLPNCEGMFTSTGGNVFGSLAGCTLTPLASDDSGVMDPGLGPVDDYGGPSLTRAVLAGSTAIDQGINPCAGTDQRGIARVMAGPCEAGAYELLAGDTDGDSVLDAAPDNCPNIVNARQEDNEGDGQGDVCDPDDDNDAVMDTADNCDFAANADQADFDGDGIGNACDPTPGSPPTGTTPTTTTPTTTAPPPAPPVAKQKKCKKRKKGAAAAKKCKKRR